MRWITCARARRATGSCWTRKRTGPGQAERRTRATCTVVASTPAASHVRVLQLAHLALQVPLVAVDRQEALGVLDRLLLRPCLEQGEAADHFLGLGEGSIGRRKLAVKQPHASAVRR